MRITEQGSAAFIFCSEDIFKTAMQEAVDNALYEYEMNRTIRAGINDLAQDDYFIDSNEALAEAKKRAAKRENRGETP